MNPTSFEDFFRSATKGNDPYNYQCRLACGEQNNPSVWLTSGAACKSRLINISTGLGKTAAVVLAWLWNRVQLQNPKWPRRLVYCLPMRTLVEQTAGEVKKWIAAILADEKGELALGDEIKAKLEWLAANSPVILMGGDDAGDWDIYPEENAILIGTQDMLLSRALNRGYGMSRYRWPMHFGLLNNDCLWVMDETQLMGPGLSTACQLESFRATNASSYGSFGAAGSVTWYMSATSNREHLNTREWRGVARPAEFDFTLSLAEKAATSGPIHQRRFAAKRLELEPASGFESLIASILKRHGEMVEAIAKNSELPARTLIICNTVDRAVNVHALIAAGKPEGCDLLLLHSRFRPPERKNQTEHLKAITPSTFPKGQIVVATQVIEAGVDLSSAILCSEVAPLASLVQRLGRLNRAGEFQNCGWKPVAMIVGVGVESAPPRETKDEAKKREDRNTGRCLPYELPACESAWESLKKLDGNASPASLELIQDAVAASIPRCPYSLQRHELIDFFDTDANLSLGFTDVSPFVRGLDDDTDLQVCWREMWSENDGPPEFVPDYQHDELCSVPIGKAFKARDILNRGWLWRGKESSWISVRDAGIAPGMTILLPLSAGGYDNAAGWTGNKDDNKHSSHYQPKDEPSDEEQLSCLANGWRSIETHTAEVASELTGLLGHLLATSENQQEHEALLNAVPWHDVGKNHPDWQKAVLDALEKAGIAGKDEHLPFAKFSLSDSLLLRNQDGSFHLSGQDLKREVKRLRRFFRPGIAHEVASALAFRQAEQNRIGVNRPIFSLLAEYVIMSHHGRVRKVLRDEIPRFPDDAKDNDTVRGVRHASAIPFVAIDGKNLGSESLSTDCRRMGRDANGHESYTRDILRLLDHYGPFRLAFFETVFRAADIRASITASREHRA
ncbi:MAG: DEAD/DEAH box helicase [Verrucomicrobiales bacterium]|nr:DEAD/DEAH box helicase [Verrucomicrobiales bacterium]